MSRQPQPWPLKPSPSTIWYGDSSSYKWLFNVHFKNRRLNVFNYNRSNLWRIYRVWIRWIKKRKVKYKKRGRRFKRKYFTNLNRMYTMILPYKISQFGHFDLTGRKPFSKYQRRPTNRRKSTKRTSRRRFKSKRDFKKGK